jgi:hypothetical protein
MAICKLCKKEKPLIKKSHIIPEFLHKDLYDEKHRLKKFNANGFSIEKTKVSKLPSGEYDGNLLCRECDGDILGAYESYLGKVLSKTGLTEDKKPICNKIKNENGVELLQVDNIDYKLTKLVLLTILWRAGISNRKTFRNVKLGPYEEKIRKQLYDGLPLNENEIDILILSWTNDNKMPTDVIGQPQLHKKDGKFFYTLIVKGYVVIYFISKNQVPEVFKEFKLKQSNKLTIVHLPKGFGMEFLINYTGANKK